VNHNFPCSLTPLIEIDTAMIEKEGYKKVTKEP